MRGIGRLVRFLAGPALMAIALPRGRASIFLALLPNRLDAYSVWLRLMAAQALQDIARAAERPQEAHAPLRRPQGPRAALRAPQGQPEDREDAQETVGAPERRTDAARPVYDPAPLPAGRICRSWPAGGDGAVWG